MVPDSGDGILRMRDIGWVWSCSIVDGKVLRASSSILIIFGTPLLAIVSGRWFLSGVVGGVGFPEDWKPIESSFPPVALHDDVSKLSLSGGSSYIGVGGGLNGRLIERD